LPKQEAQIEVLTFSPDGKTLASGDQKGQVTLWDVATTDVTPRRFLPLPGPVFGLAFSPDGKTLYAGPAGGTGEAATKVKRWDVATGAVLPELDAGFPFGWLAVSPDGKTLAVTRGGPDALLDLPTARPRTKLTGIAPGTFHQPAFAPDGRAVAVPDVGGVSVFDAATGAAVRRFDLPGPVHSVAFAPDGRHLVLGNANGTVYVLRWALPEATAP
jgi:WD40 repeat protein